MHLNRTPMWKVMTIQISRELLMFNFERLDILCPRIGYSNHKLWTFEFLERFCCSILSVSIYYAPESDIRVKSYDDLNFSRSFVVQFRASRYMILLNWTYEWKVLTIWISRVVPLFNFQRLDILCLQIGHPFEKIGPFEFLESFRCSISRVVVYYAPALDIRVKSYDHLNFSGASIVKFRVSWYIMLLNQTSMWKFMTIGISWGHPLFNFKRLDILCA